MVMFEMLGKEKAWGCGRGGKKKGGGFLNYIYFYYSDYLDY